MGLKIAGRRWGHPQGPRVLALHGWLDNLSSFEALAKELPQYQWVAVDLPGHGHSEYRSDDGAYHVIDGVTFVPFLMDALGWDRCHFICHSLGACIASLFAASFPERVEKLCLIEGLGPVPQRAHEIPQRLHTYVDELKAIRDKSKPVYESEELAARARKIATPMSDAAVLALVRRGTEKVPGGITWRSDARLRTSSPMRLTEDVVREFLTRIEAQTCLICGNEAQTPLSVLLKSRVPLVKKIEFHELAGNHHLHMDSPAEVAAVIAKFINVH